ncbi:MAG: rod shape-determining protein MreD [Chitinophagaceae bacterium]
MAEPIKIIFRFILFILVQALVLNHMPPLHRFITPYLYFLFILWMPFKTGRPSLMVVAFLLGLSLDMFLHTPGIHIAPCVLIAYLRPFIINLLVPKETKELSLGSPSRTTMGFAPYALYVVVLTIVHHSYLVLLEWMQFGSLWFFFGKVFFTTLVSLLLITITEFLFSKRGRRFIG